MKKLALVVLALGIGVAALPAGTARAQQGPPPGQQPPGGGPQHHGMDRNFVYGHMINAIDAKASILLSQGKSDLAVEELKRVLTLDIPRDHPVYEARCHAIGRLAITYTNLNRKKEALELLQKLLAEVPPGSVAEMTAMLDAGTVYRQSDMPEEALKAFDRAIELSQKLASSLPRQPAGKPPQPGNRQPAPPPN